MRVQVKLQKIEFLRSKESNYSNYVLSTDGTFAEHLKKLREKKIIGKLNAMIKMHVLTFPHPVHVAM